MIYTLTERKLGISDQVQCFVTIVLHCYRDIGRVVQEKREFLRKSRNLDTKKKLLMSTSLQDLEMHQLHKKIKAYWHTACSLQIF